jgi:hypothetical protein
VKSTVFEQMVKDSGMTPMQKQNVGGVSVMLAEGMIDYKYEQEEPKWIVMYAIGLGEDMDVANKVEIPAWVNVPTALADAQGNPLFNPTKVSQDERVKIVMELATEWIKSNKIAKRYEA